MDEDLAIESLRDTPQPKQENIKIPKDKSWDSSTQKKRIIISKDLAEKVKKDWEEERKKVLSKKPDIYYIAQAE